MKTALLDPRGFWAIFLVVLAAGLLLPFSHGAAGDEFWDDRFEELGISGRPFTTPVRAMEIFQGNLYVGGLFTHAGELEINNIARWNGTNWVAVGGGVEGGVGALLSWGGKLYVGGGFTQAGDKPARALASWDGEQWEEVGGGVDGGISALAAAGDRLYVGGHFTRAGNVECNHVAMWDGREWHPLGDGVSKVVRSTAGLMDIARVRSLLPWENLLFVAGEFWQAGGLNATNIAAWDGSGWDSLDGGANVPGVRAIAFQGQVYAGGSFTQIGGVPANGLARWDGSSWAAIEGARFISAMAASPESLFVGHTFADDESIRMRRWDGESWHVLGSGMDGIAQALQISENQLFVGGIFDEAAGKPAHNFTIWHLPGKLAARQAGEEVEVSWAAGHTSAVLESSASAAEPEWSPVEMEPVKLGGQMKVSLPADASQQFFRLRLEDYAGLPGGQASEQSP